MYRDLLSTNEKPSTNQNPRHPRAIIAIEFTSASFRVRNTYFAVLTRLFIWYPSDSLESNDREDETDESSRDNPKSLSVLSALYNRGVCCFNGSELCVPGTKGVFSLIVGVRPTGVSCMLPGMPMFWNENPPLMSMEACRVCDCLPKICFVKGEPSRSPCSNERGDCFGVVGISLGEVREKGDFCEVSDASLQLLYELITPSAGWGGGSCKDFRLVSAMFALCWFGVSSVGSELA